jgi:hypothetical protein
MLLQALLMPLQSAEYWLRKADRARKSAQKVRGEPAKTAMLEIAKAYELLAEQKRRLERLG